MHQNYNIGLTARISDMCDVGLGSISFYKCLYMQAQVTNSGCVYWQNYSLRFHIASCVN